MAHSKEADVVIIGGGPAGSTAGALLAEKGWRVVILEKERFPRYHIGESLMPYCYFTFERLGVLDKIRQLGYVKKHSVQFVGRNGKVSTPFYFFQHLDHAAATTWQVWRQDFDTMMLDHARERGAEVREDVKVTAFLRNDKGVVDGVRAKPAAGEPIDLKARLVIDASGRDALWLRKSGWRKRDAKLNKISIWTLYRGAKRDPGLDEGATTVAYLEGKGWFWNIPLQDDVVSAGIVAERDYLFRDTRDPKAVFEAGNQKQSVGGRAPPARETVRSVLGDGRIFLPFGVLRQRWPGFNRRCLRLSGSGILFRGIPGFEKCGDGG